MAKDKIEKKLLHIEVKDNGLLLSQKIGQDLADTKSTLQNGIINNLISGSDTKSLTRYRIAQNNKLRDFKYETHKLIDETKKSVKTALKSDTTVNLNEKQVTRMSKSIDKGLLFLEKSAVSTYQNTLNNMFLKVKSAEDLKDQLQKHIDSGFELGVVYKDGKNYKFDSYWEMKTRTDIQQDIGSNMINAGHSNGVIFYVAAYFGDCAKDHVDYQGKIYYDKDWRTMAPKDRLDEIEDYISQNCEMSVQDVVTEKGNFLTTRPNCRHYFQYVDIDSVLGAKTEKEVSKLRDSMDLNFNGKYRPEKYEALQKQRANERKIREEKEKVTKLEQSLALDVGNKKIRSQIMSGEATIRRYQANQRELIKQYNNLERSYMREQAGKNRVTMGVDGKNILIEDEKTKTSVITSSPKYAVDFKYIESRKYNDKVLKSLDNKLEDKRVLYPAIKQVLAHRSGTNGEDLIIYNTKTKMLYIKNDSDKASKVVLNDKEKRMIKNDSKNILTIHNHPASLPPSVDDINALYQRKQNYGIVITHDGRIFKYSKPKDYISDFIVKSVLEKTKGKNYNEFEKQEYVIKELSKLYDFSVKEVK